MGVRARHVPWSVGRRIAAAVRRVGRRAGESLRAVVLLAAALCVALTAAMTFISLQKTSAEHRESRHLLSSLRSDLYESLYLQEEAIVLGGLDAELDVELRASLDRGAARVAGLRRFDGGGIQESVTQRLFASYRSALEDEAVLLRAGDIDGARRLEDLRVDPAFHDLADVIDEHLADHEAAADRLELQADVGSVVTLSVAAMVIWLLASRQRKAHLAAERASAQRRATEESERRFRALVQQSSDMTMVVSPDLDIRYVAPSAAQVLGYEPDEFCHLAKGLLHPDDVAKLRSRVAELAHGASGAGMAIEYRIRHRDGGWRHMEAMASNAMDEPAIAGLVLNNRDATERKALEEQLTHRALHDPLTELANRALFHDRVHHALVRRRRGDVAVLFLDVDDFKTVNDVLGHAAGDELLTRVAAQLRTAVRPSDTVARLGGDEFAVLFEDLGDQAEVEHVAARILAGLKELVVLERREISPRASIGIAVAGSGHADPDELMRNADVAMYEAKRAGKDRYVVFHAGMHNAVLARLELEIDLRSAVDTAEELFLEYQPIYSVQTNEILGAEALVRWNHPRRGRIGPLEFIPLAEDTGLITPLGDWVLREACAQASLWARDGQGGAPYVSVNVSVHQLKETTFPDRVAAILAQTGLEPVRLMLELTESVVMQDMESNIAQLEALKILGVRLAIDDFGTGYSSLNYLRRLPVDTVKIDRAFVQQVDSEAEDSAVARAIVQLAKSFNLRTVAEGIEEIGQLSELAALGCDAGQGFLFARPLPLDRIQRLFAADSPAETLPVTESPVFRS